MSLRAEDDPLGNGWYLAVDRNDEAVAAFTTRQAAEQYCEEKNEAAARGHWPSLADRQRAYLMREALRAHDKREDEKR